MCEERGKEGRESKTEPVKERADTNVEVKSQNFLLKMYIYKCIYFYFVRSLNFFQQFTNTYFNSKSKIE